MPKFDGDKYTKNVFLPIVFHNLKSYDAHFVIRHFKKQYTALSGDQDDDEQEESYGDIRVTPLNGEKYLYLSDEKSSLKGQRGVVRVTSLVSNFYIVDLENFATANRRYAGLFMTPRPIGQ